MNPSSQAALIDWKELRVVVTGGAGFLGSALVESLTRRGAQSIFCPRSKDYDLRRSIAVRRLLEEHRPDIVLHLAARTGGIGANRSRPAEYFYDNLMMGVPLLHESWRCGVRKFVAVGSVCSYPKHTPIPFKEEDLWDGYPEETNAPYGLAKKMLLVQSQAYRQQYGFNAIFLLSVNLYGPRDNFDLETSHVIPAVIRRFLEAKEQGRRSVTLWGSGSPTREFLYVKDAAEGIVLAAERYDGDDPVNLGSGNEISIRNLARLVAELTEYEGEVLWDPDYPDGQPRRCLDVEKAKQRFGFRAKTAQRDGLQEAIQWYLSDRLNRVV